MQRTERRPAGVSVTTRSARWCDQVERTTLRPTQEIGRTGDGRQLVEVRESFLPAINPDRVSTLWLRQLTFFTAALCCVPLLGILWANGAISLIPVHLAARANHRTTEIRRWFSTPTR